jgi:hypothetical protein
MLVEEVDAVTATLNTAGNDLRCAISRNGGTGWDYVALENKGLWGTNKKILVANNVPFSNSVSGTDMRYKLEWANQVAATAGTSGLIDQSGTSKTVTNSGVTQSSAITPKWGAKALYFNGSSKLTVSAHTDFDFAAADVTIEFWEYTVSGGNNRVICRGSHPGEWFYRSRFAEVSEDFKSQIGGSNQASSVTGRHGGTTTWTHVAIVRDGSNIRVYTGGVQRWSTAVSGNWTVTSTANAIGIGTGIDAGTAEWFTGYLQDIRISNTARYPSGTTFSVPSAAFTTDSNTKLLISGNDGADVAGHQVKVHATSLAWA